MGVEEEGALGDRHYRRESQISRTRRVGKWAGSGKNKSSRVFNACPCEFYSSTWEHPCLGISASLTKNNSPYPRPLSGAAIVLSSRRAFCTRYSDCSSTTSSLPYGESMQPYLSTTDVTNRLASSQASIEGEAPE